MQFPSNLCAPYMAPAPPTQRYGVNYRQHVSLAVMIDNSPRTAPIGYKIPECFLPESVTTGVTPAILNGLLASTEVHGPVTIVDTFGTNLGTILY